MNVKEQNRPGFGSRGEYLVAIQFALMIGFALLPVWHPGISPGIMDASWAWRSAAALAFALLSLAFGALGSHHIRDYLTPLPYPVDHSQLVQRGVYAIVRHPLYASLLLAGLAWTLYNLSLSHLLALGVCFCFRLQGKQRRSLADPASSGICRLCTTRAQICPLGILIRYRLRAHGGCLRSMFSYSIRIKFNSYSSEAAPNKHPSSQHPSSKHPVCHALMSCLFDPDPDPDQVALGGLHPGVSSVHLSRRQRPRAFLPGKARRLPPLRWHHLPGRPQAGS